MTAVAAGVEQINRIHVMEDSEYIPDPLAVITDYMLLLCEPCGSSEEARAEALRQAYWADDNRLSTQRAAHKALKAADCTAVILADRELALDNGQSDVVTLQPVNPFANKFVKESPFDLALRQVTLSCMSGLCLSSQEERLKEKLTKAAADNVSVNPEDLALETLDEMACPKLSCRKAFGPCK